jgi:hypothetical protein
VVRTATMSFLPSPTPDSRNPLVKAAGRDTESKKQPLV